MSEQNNVSKQDEGKNPVSRGCGCVFLAIVLLHVFSVPIKRIVECLFDN